MWYRMKSKTLIVAGYEVRQTIGKKAFLFISVVLPMILVVAVFVALPLLPEILGSLGGVAGFEDTDIGYIDSLGYIEPLEGFVEFPDEESAKRAIETENISLYFILSDNYPDDGNITLYTAGTIEFNEPWEDISWLLRTSLMEHWGYPEEQVDRVIQPFRANVVKLDSGGAIGSSAGGALEFVLPYGFGLLLLLTIMMSSGYLMQAIGEEKENRTGELLLSSISADQLLRGKILGYGSLGILQGGMYALAGILIITISPLAPFFAGLQLGGIVGIGIIYFFMGYALFASSVAMTAAISSSAKEAQQSSMLFTMMAVIPIALITLIVKDPNSIIAMALTYIPYTSPFVMMMRMSLTTVPIFELAASLIILALSIFLVSKLAGKIFRMGMLKYDKRASLKEILGFIREK
jgi:ABC-2 type transport system permease protein